MRQFNTTRRFDRPLRRLLLARTALASARIIRPVRSHGQWYSWEDVS